MRARAASASHIYNTKKQKRKTRRGRLEASLRRKGLKIEEENLGRTERLERATTQ